MELFGDPGEAPGPSPPPSPEQIQKKLMPYDVSFFMFYLCGGVCVCVCVYTYNLYKIYISF